MKLLLTLALGCVALALGRPTEAELPDYTFEAFLQEFGKAYPSRTEYELRKSLFKARVASFIKHNNENSDYTLNVNQLADMSDDEIRRFKGYNKPAGRAFRNTNTDADAKTLEELDSRVPTTFADSLDWRTKGAITPVKNQGGCGSCWAFGSAETLESHTFLFGKDHKLPLLSEQQLVDCAPNPKHCGGTGGCEGSIPELAYGYVKDNGGLATEADYPYRGRDMKCQKKPSSATVTGFVNVPSNNYTAIMAALQIGPLAVTVAAEPWQFYSGGIYTGCTKSGSATDLDHVVQLVGYGTDAGKDYWLVRNSWAKSFGEDGYIRVLRHTNEEWCGTDREPADGTGCSGGPPTVNVCGSCGILYDAVYPLVV